ncbi:MAG: hypothetical protein KKF16_01980 [Euryarchaeota archaeon]|nr:hypothetical protein [Euryarchaeota archaeon]MBU4607745.1 hypothetical protein [Euryarchaeota archaeon]
MDYSTLKNKLEKKLSVIKKIEGVEGTLVVDNQGNVLYSDLHAQDDSLFGSMANIISNSSLKLLQYTRQGSGERILVESSQGKALFLSLKKAHLLILTNKKANIGRLMLTSKKLALKIQEMPEIKSLESTATVKTEEIHPIKFKKESEDAITSVIDEKELVASSPAGFIEKESDIVKEKAAVLGEDESTASKSEIESSLSEDSVMEKEMVEDREDESIEEYSNVLETSDNGNIDESVIKDPSPLEITEDTPVEIEEKEAFMEIPVIKPPISFPELPDEIIIPLDLEEKSKLIIDIYESILLAMSIGASKIMGVSPARGMLKKSLPLDQCPELLEGVDVKSNSVLEFDKIRKNLEKYPLENRVEQSINDLSILISAITNNYGRVMGYDAFRGMIRVEFKKIYISFGVAMEELDIKSKIHPELKELLVK